VEVQWHVLINGLLAIFRTRAQVSASDIHSGGITKLTNIASHEWAGILLVYVLTVSSPVAQHYVRNHFDDRDSKFQRKISNQQKRKSNQRQCKCLLLEHGLLTRGE
jgi:hypothetical protein